MNIEKFYYDEQTEMYEQMKKEQDEHEQSLSVEEREKEHQKLFQEARTVMEKAERKKKEEYQIINLVKYQIFIYLSERAIQFSKISGCNIKIIKLVIADLCTLLYTRYCIDRTDSS